MVGASRWARTAAILRRSTPTSPIRRAARALSSPPTTGCRRWKMSAATVTRALVSRLRGRGDNDLYLIDLESHAETLVTPHDPPGSFSGQLAPDGRSIYLASDKDRDRAAFVRMRIDGAGKPPPQLVAGRDDAELGGFAINGAGNDGGAACGTWRAEAN